MNPVYKICRYLNNNISKNPGRIAFDTVFVPTYENLFEGSTNKLDYWKDFYPDEAEARPRKKLESLGGAVTFWVYVDANHTGNLSNRSSHSGILIYVNNTLINFYINIQNTV